MKYKLTKSESLTMNKLYETLNFGCINLRDRLIEIGSSLVFSCSPFDLFHLPCLRVGERRVSCRM